MSEKNLDSMLGLTFVFNQMYKKYTEGVLPLFGPNLQKMYGQIKKKIHNGEKDELLFFYSIPVIKV